MLLAVLLGWALLVVVTAVVVAALGRAGLQDELIEELVEAQAEARVGTSGTAGR